MLAAFHVAGTVLQVALILNKDNKDGMIESPANFKSFGATLPGGERETGHAFYVVGFENIRLYSSTRYRIR